jgi:NADH-quinone oxidoreductase subunit M
MIEDFGGVARPMPVYAAFFGIVTMSSIGLPGLNGFVGEFLILLGTYLTHPIAAVVAASGVVLAAAYMLWMYRRVMFGPIENAENRSLIDLGLREKLVMVLMVIPIIWIGVYPEPFLRRIEPSVVELLGRMEERSAMTLVELPATELPATELPATELPDTELPAAEAPAGEEPAAEEPGAEAPATELPAAEVPAAEAPAAEEQP